MNRRQFLGAAVGAGALTAVGSLSPRDGVAAHPTDGETGPDTATTGAGTRSSTDTETGTPTPTPTEPAATPTSDYEPLGGVDVPGATETVLTPDGETAFVATGDGFAVLDLSDPADPTLRTEERDISPPGTDQGLDSVFDVKYDDGRLLVVGPANYAPDGFHGLIRYDVTDPATPELRASHQTAFPIHNCTLDGNYAYLTGNNREDNPLVVVDVSGEEPREVARWSLFDHDAVWESVPIRLRTLHDVVVRDGVAYLAYWDAGTWLLDVSDPTDPTYVADIRERSAEELADLDGLAVAREGSEPPGNDHYAAPNDDGTLLAVGKESWNSNFGVEGTTPGPDDPGGPSGIDLYDVSEPADPRQLATIDPPPTADPNYRGVRTTAHNFEIAASHLYSSWYRGGVKVHDLSDPANPEQVRYFRRSRSTSFWTAQLAAPGGAVVATSYYDPSDLDAPARVYTFPDVPRAGVTGTESAAADGSAGSTATASTTAPTPTETQTGGPDPDGRTGSEPNETGDSTGGTGPGFGPLAALGALGLGTWRLLRGGTQSADEQDR